MINSQSWQKGWKRERKERPIRGVGLGNRANAAKRADCSFEGGTMGREFIGDYPASGEGSELDDYEAELAIKYIKQECKPPRGVNVQVTWEDHELGSYPVISVVWDDYVTDYPGEYIGKCVEAFDHFDLPEEIHERNRVLFDLQDRVQKLFKLD
jgi:hypothetical protein